MRHLCVIPYETGTLLPPMTHSLSSRERNNGITYRNSWTGDLPVISVMALVVPAAPPSMIDARIDEHPDIARHACILAQALRRLHGDAQRSGAAGILLDALLLLRGWTQEIHLAACSCADECPALDASSPDVALCCSDGQELGHTDPDCAILHIRLEEILTPYLEAAGA